MPGGIGGFAGDYVEAMWLMLQQPRPDDYVVATGETHSVSDFVELAFAEAGLDWRRYVEIDSRYLRPTEVDELRGDASKAREVLRWQPRVPFVELVKMMVATILNSPAATEPYPRPASVPQRAAPRRWGQLTTMAPIIFPLRGRRVFVAGHRGMVGSALVRRLEQEEYKHSYRRSRPGRFT